MSVVYQEDDATALSRSVDWDEIYGDFRIPTKPNPSPPPANVVPNPSFTAKLTVTPKNPMHDGWGNLTIQIPELFGNNIELAYMTKDFLQIIWNGQNGTERGEYRFFDMKHTCSSVSSSGVSHAGWAVIFNTISFWRYQMAACLTLTDKMDWSGTLEDIFASCPGIEPHFDPLLQIWRVSVETKGWGRYTAEHVDLIEACAEAALAYIEAESSSSEDYPNYQTRITTLKARVQFSIESIKNRFRFYEFETDFPTLVSKEG